MPCTREQVHACFAQPGHWLGPVTGPGWLGPAQPIWAELDPAPKHKKIKNMCMHEKKYKFILLVYLLPESRIKINTDLNLLYFILFSYIKIKNICMRKNKFILFVYSLTLESGIKILI